MRLPFIPCPIAGVTSSQALLVYLITAHQSVCVPTDTWRGELTCGFQTQKQKGMNQTERGELTCGFQTQKQKGMNQTERG